MSLPLEKRPSAAGMDRPTPLSIQVHKDGSFSVFDKNKKHRIPNSFAISTLQGRGAQRKPQHWKRVHTILERFLKDFTILQGYMVTCSARPQREGLRIVDQHKQRALEYILERNIDFHEAHERISRLPRSQGTVMVFLRSQLPTCWEALKRSFSSPPSSDEFIAGARLVEGVTRLLWEALHLADQVLEAHFRHEGRKV